MTQTKLDGEELYEAIQSKRYNNYFEARDEE